MAIAAQGTGLAGNWTRRGALGLILALAVPLPRAGQAQEEGGPVLLVSRKRLLNETAHAQALSKAEIELTAELQRRVDMVKAELAAEEQELAKLRNSLPRDEFDRRVALFDRRVRDERRLTQQHATKLQNALRAERLKLVEAIGPLLEAVRATKGAQAILNADQVLAADPAIDVTAEVIAQFNKTVPPPIIPDLKTLAPEEGAPAPSEPAQQ